MPWSRTERRRAAAAFTLVELLVALVLAGITVAGLYTFLGKQRKTSVAQRLRADIESLDTISFFIIGRDIRRAGSNPKGILGGSYSTPGADLPLAEVAFDRVRIQADLNGDQVISPNTDEDVTYEYVSSTPGGAKDQIRRQAGNQLLIENVRSFDLDYYCSDNAWYCKAGRCPAPYDTGIYVSPPTDPATIRKVRIHLVAGTGRINPNTGSEDLKEIQESILLRNFK